MASAGLQKPQSRCFDHQHAFTVYSHHLRLQLCSMCCLQEIHALRRKQQQAWASLQPSLMDVARISTLAR